MRILPTLAMALSLTISPGLYGDIVGTSVQIAGCIENPSFSCTTESTNSQFGFGTPSQTSFSGSVSLATGANVSMSGTAYAGAGVLEGYASLTVTSAMSPVTFIATEVPSGMSDTLTISDPTLNGTPGSLLIGLSLDATANATDTSTNGILNAAVLDAYTGVPVSGFPTAGSAFVFAASLNTSYAGTAIPFTYGQPFSIEAYLETVALLECQDATACASWSGGPITVDATHTAVIDSLSVFDANGNPVSSANWSATAASGLDYTATGIAAPEPSSLALLGTGLLMSFATAGLLRRSAKSRADLHFLLHHLRKIIHVPHSRIHMWSHP
jgi:hypothetical protein